MLKMLWMLLAVLLAAPTGGDKGEVEVESDDEGAGGGPGDGGKGEESGSDDGEGAGKPDPDSTPKFTQADLDRRIDQRMARLKREHEEALKAEREKAGLADAERLELEKKQAEEKAAETLKRSGAKLVRLRAEAIALGAGVRPDRVAAFLGTLDLSDVELDDDLDPDVARIKDIVDAGIELVPEFRGKGGPPPKADGDGSKPPDGEGDKKVWTAAEVAKLSVKEFAEHEDEILRQTAAGLIK